MRDMDAGLDEGFVRRTYRSAAVVTGIVLFLLASYDQFDMLLPVLLGAVLGVTLLYSLDIFVRRAFTLERAFAVKKKVKGAGAGRALLALALVKYPLVALLIWAVTRLWEPRHVVAFAGGFILIQAVIALRGAGRFLVERMNETPLWPEEPRRGRKEQGVAGSRDAKV